MKSHTTIFLFITWDMCWSKTLAISKLILYLIVHKVNEYIGESNLNKYLTLVPTDESKETLKKYKAQWYKIRYLIRSITNN